MEVIDFPIQEYLRYFRKTACNNGYKWIMLFLARELDAQNSYEQLRASWNSFNDLTGSRIIFLMSVATKNKSEGSLRIGSNYLAMKYPHLTILNNNPLYLAEQDYPDSYELQYRRARAIENNSNYISDLCEEFDINESSVPAILLFDTEEKGYVEPCVVIPMETDDLYKTIKSIISKTQKQFKEYESCYKEHKETLSKEYAVESKIQSCKLTKQEEKYLKNKNKLIEILDSNNNFNRQEILHSIEIKDKTMCENYAYPLKGCILYIINTLLKDPEFENRISHKKESEKELCLELEKIDREVYTSKLKMDAASFKLKQAVSNYASTKMNKPSLFKYKFNAGIPNFKIGVTFSGTYRDKYVEPMCQALLKYGFTKEEIFYDSWHAALINGVSSDNLLRKIYNEHCECIVVFLSPSYIEKSWTSRIEWPAIKELIHQNQGEKICLLSVDSPKIDELGGLYTNQSIYKEIDNMTPIEIASFVFERYMYISSHNKNSISEDL